MEVDEQPAVEQIPTSEEAPDKKRSKRPAEVDKPSGDLQMEETPKEKPVIAPRIPSSLDLRLCRKRNSELSDRLEYYRASRGDFRLANQKCQSDLTGLKTEHEELKKVLGEANAQLTAAGEKLAAAEEQNRSNNEASEEIQNGLKAKIEELGKASNECNEMVQLWTIKSQDQAVTIGNLEDQLRRVIREKDEKASDLQTVKFEKTQLDSRIEQLTAEIQQFQGLNQQLTTQLATANEASVAANSQLENAKLEFTTKEAEIAQLTAQLAAEKTANETWKVRNNDFMERIRTLETALNDSEQSKKACDDNMLSINLEIGKVRGQLAESQVSNQTLTAANLQLNQQLTAAKAANESYEATNSRLQADIKQLNGELQTVNQTQGQSLTECNQRIQGLQTELGKFKNANDLWEARYKKTVDAAKIQANDLEQKANQSNEQLQKQIKSLQNEITNLQLKNSNSELQLRQATAEKANQIAPLQEENKTLREQVRCIDNFKQSLSATNPFFTDILQKLDDSCVNLKNDIILLCKKLLVQIEGLSMLNNPKLDGFPDDFKPYIKRVVDTAAELRKYNNLIEMSADDIIHYVYDNQESKVEQRFAEVIKRVEDNIQNKINEEPGLTLFNQFDQTATNTPAMEKFMDWDVTKRIIETVDSLNPEENPNCRSAIYLAKTMRQIASALIIQNEVETALKEDANQKLENLRETRDLIGSVMKGDTVQIRVDAPKDLQTLGERLKEWRKFEENAKELSAALAACEQTREQCKTAAEEAINAWSDAFNKSNEQNQVLQEENNQIRALIETFKTNLETYKQASESCKTDCEKTIAAWSTALQESTAENITLKTQINELENALESNKKECEKAIDAWAAALEQFNK